MAIIVEIRSAEGGADSRQLVREQTAIYMKASARHGVILDVIESRPGAAVLRASGKGAVKLFEHEAGGHRHQRVPPNEKRGRVHTSTVTVAVLPVPSESEVQINERDLEWKTCRSNGPGGQSVNTTDSAVQVTHLPTGLQVRCESEKSQLQNKEAARALLRARLQQTATDRADQERNGARKSQLGSGQRGDKTRTYRHQDDIVTDHSTGKKAALQRVLRGFLEDLW